MYGHSCFLRIGTDDNAGFAGLTNDGYELLSFNFAFGQGTDSNGMAQTEVLGGTINLIYPNVPSVEFLKWMSNPEKLEDGAIVVCDADNHPVEKVYFKDAACVGLDINYMERGNGYQTTKLTLEARIITMGTTSLEKNWVNYGNK